MAPAEEEEQEEKAFTTLWINLNRLSLSPLWDWSGLPRSIGARLAFGFCFVWNKRQAKELREQLVVFCFLSSQELYPRHKSTLVYSIRSGSLFRFKMYSFISSFSCCETSLWISASQCCSINHTPFWASFPRKQASTIRSISYPVRLTTIPHSISSTSAAAPPSAVQPSSPSSYPQSAPHSPQARHTSPSPTQAPHH